MVAHFKNQIFPSSYGPTLPFFLQKKLGPQGIDELVSLGFRRLGFEDDALWRLFDLSWGYRLDADIPDPYLPPRRHLTELKRTHPCHPAQATSIVAQLLSAAAP